MKQNAMKTSKIMLVSLLFSLLFSLGLIHTSFATEQAYGVTPVTQTDAAYGLIKDVKVINACDWIWIPGIGWYYFC